MWRWLYRWLYRPLPVLLLCASSVHSTLAAGGNTGGTLKSEACGYAAEYPAGWRPDPTRLDGIFDIINFPLRKAVHAVFLPPNGAEITVFPIEVAQGHPKTLAEWIETDAARGAELGRRVLARRVLESGKAPSMPYITELVVRSGSAPPDDESVSWYFEINGRPFLALLSYWQDNPRPAALIGAMRQVVATLKTDRPGGGGRTEGGTACGAPLPTKAVGVLPKFSQHKVLTVFHGRPAEPRLDTEFARSYRTRIRAAAKKGPNFAGSYTIANWGCGTSCLQMAVIDERTGAVFNGPFLGLDYDSSLGYADGSSTEDDKFDPLSYRLNSRLLVVRGCQDNIQARNCALSYYEWAGNKFRLIDRRLAVVVPQREH